MAQGLLPSVAVMQVMQVLQVVQVSSNVALTFGYAER
jgi:hypothetical protein